MSDYLSDAPPYVDHGVAKGTQRVLSFLRRYHQHRVVGLEHIPLQGRCLVVVNHSFATYDIVMLGMSIVESRGRLPRALADRLVFKIPLMADWARGLGAVIGDPESARSLLAQGELVMVAPGGMREALRPRQQRYQLSWERRYGFARLALETQTPVAVAACPAADDLFDVYDNAATKWIYERCRFPLPIVRGLGPTWLPRPKALTHYIAPLIRPPHYPQTPAAQHQVVEQFQHHITEVMQKMLQRRD